MNVLTPTGHGKIGRTNGVTTDESRQSVDRETVPSGGEAVTDRCVVTQGESLRSGTNRCFLFLQGPPGPFFWLLGRQLRARGFAVRRINLNGGDRHDWPEATTDFRGRMSRWPLFVDRYLREHRVTDLILYGDCRPLHKIAHGMAKLLRINIHVLEEGYIRPDWMTFEPDGVNGNSTLRRDAVWLEQEARSIAPVANLPPITASFRRRARDSYWYYHRVVTGRLRFPFYRSHRPGSIIVDGIGWLAKFGRARWRQAEAEAVLNRLSASRFFLFPLQLSADYQIRAHSPFKSMSTAVEFVLSSFARCAPADALLLVKEHPLDSSFVSWRSFLRRAARRHGLGDRVLHLAGGDLTDLSRSALGVVCVNSTSGTVALRVGTPVIVLGSALYDLAGLTHQGDLDAFWHAPVPPVPRVHEAFCKVLHALCLVRGGLASRSATDILVNSVMERLLNDPQHAVYRRPRGDLHASLAIAETEQPSSGTA